MKDKLNRFIDNLNGQFVEISSKEALYQCMDLAYVWVFCLDLPKATIQNQYAYQVYTNPKDITRQYFDLIPNTPSGIPQDGDLVVWSNNYGPAGHIAIALGGGTINSFRCFEQNNPLGTKAHISQRSYTNVLGWLRPKLQNTQEVELLQKVDLSSLDNNTPLKEIYGILELDTLKAKIIAKDLEIHRLRQEASQNASSEATPPIPEGNTDIEIQQNLISRFIRWVVNLIGKND